MAAPLTNPVWIYGDDDDTLFRLIAPEPHPGLERLNLFDKLNEQRENS